MDAIHSGVTLEAVTKPHPVEKRRRIFKSSEWDLEEPAAFARVARSPVELALITGVVIRLFRAVVLTHGDATTSYLGAALVLGHAVSARNGDAPPRKIPRSRVAVARAAIRGVRDRGRDDRQPRAHRAAPRAVGNRARRIRRLAGDGDRRRVLARARRERLGAAARRHGVVHPRTRAQGDRQGSRATDASRWAALHRAGGSGTNSRARSVSRRARVSYAAVVSSQYLSNALVRSCAMSSAVRPSI